MLNKIRTPIIDVAFKAAANIPPDVQRAIEHEFHMYLNLFVGAFSARKEEKLFLHLREFVIAEMRELLDAYDSRTPSAPVPIVTCEDWKRGLRTPQGTCTNCGTKH